MTALGRARAWLAAAPDTLEATRNLAEARIIVAAHALWIMLSRDLTGLIADPPREIWDEVSVGWRLRYGLLLGQPTLRRRMRMGRPSLSSMGFLMK